MLTSRKWIKMYQIIQWFVWYFFIRKQFSYILVSLLFHSKFCIERNLAVGWLRIYKIFDGLCRACVLFLYSQTWHFPVCQLLSITTTKTSCGLFSGSLIHWFSCSRGQSFSHFPVPWLLSFSALLVRPFLCFLVPPFSGSPIPQFYGSSFSNFPIFFVPYLLVPWSPIPNRPVHCFPCFFVSLEISYIRQNTYLNQVNTKDNNMHININSYREQFQVYKHWYFCQFKTFTYVHLFDE